MEEEEEEEMTEEITQDEPYNFDGVLFYARIFLWNTQGGQLFFLFLYNKEIVVPRIFKS